MGATTQACCIGLNCKIRMQEKRKPLERENLLEPFFFLIHYFCNDFLTIFFLLQSSVYYGLVL